MGKPESWRPSDEAAAALAVLIKRSGKRKSELLDNLILNALRGPDIAASNDQGSGAVARARLRVDHEKIAAFQRRAGMTVYDARKRNRG